MNLGLNEEQLMFQEALMRFLAESISIDALRGFEQSGKAFDSAAWQGLVDLGVPGLMVPTESGGSGLGMLEMAIAAEQLGAAAAPVPFMGAVAMATQAMLLASDHAQRRSWLPRIASGEVRIAVALASAWTGQTGTATATLERGRLSAHMEAVLEAGGATHFLVILADGRAVIVESSAARVDTHASVDRTRAISSIVIDGAAGELLVVDPGSESGFAARVLATGRLALACDTLGACQALLDKSVAFAREREQFGRPIGSFQGVKYMCADMVTQLEPCRSLVWHAGMLADEGSPEAALAILQAKAHVGDVGREVSRMAIEVHGGVGFTDMLGLPYWFRRVALDRQMLGGPDRCRQEAARLQGWTG